MTNINSASLAVILAEWVEAHQAEMSDGNTVAAYRTVQTVKDFGVEEERIREVDRTRAITLINGGMDGKEAFAQARAERENA